MANEKSNPSYYVECPACVFKRMHSSKEWADYHPQEAINELAKSLDNALNPTGIRVNGFALMIFKFGQTPDHVCICSNVSREGIIATMKEFIARNEGCFVDTPTEE